jgi:TPP-dependent indolepyruvate ferredoxin oxidoreductase alpha subunit
MIELGEITQKDVKPQTDSSVSISPYLARPKHAAVLKRLDRIREKFETSPFNIYEGPDQPQLMIVCGGSGYLCARDAVASLGVDQSVGILKLTTLWPFPKKWIADHLARADQFLITEEVDPYTPATMGKKYSAKNRVISRPTAKSHRIASSQR